ncbi:MAG TPA: serine protease [Magnetospirillaceae bacterium]|nr:serine protease [Magnetospirillaceae bacterium]
MNTNTSNQHTSSHRQRNFLIIGIIGLLILLVATVTTWFLLGGGKPPQNILKDALSIKDEADSQVTVTSQLGFKITYDKTFIDAHAQVTTSAKDGLIQGEEYLGEDIKTPRSYNIVTLDLKKEDKDEQDGLWVIRPSLVILTSAREQYFEPRHGKYPGLSDTEITVKEFEPSGSHLLGREQETINGVIYEKLLYENVSPSSGTQISLMLQYVTVQNGRPHVANLHYYPKTQQGDLTPLIQAFSTMSYATPDSSAQYLTSLVPEKPAITTANVQLVADTEETVSTPKSLTEGTDVSIVAKNQLAVVRVGTIYCYDLSLLGTNAVDLTDVCGAGAGSGSIVRDDGMVCTNGHVVKSGVRDALTVKIQLFILGKDSTSLNKIADYFAGLGLIKQADMQQFVDNLLRADEDTLTSLPAILAKVPDSRISIKKEAGEYAIQLGNEPLKLKITPEKLSFNYGKTIVEATYIDSQVDLNLKSLTSSRTSDVALLDITDKRTFPVVKIGSMAELTKGDQLTVMGFPGFVDGGLTTKEKHTVPTATQGRITDLASDAAGNKLVSATTMIAQGNSGGPAFNEAGEQIGLATYASQSAADPDIGKTKFSREGIFRDVADFTKLAAEHNVSFTGKSTVNDLWYSGIDTFSQGDYSKAITAFKELGDTYGDHYLVSSFITASEDQLNAVLRRNLLIGAGAFLAILLVLGVIRLIKVLRHHPGQVPPSPQMTTPGVPLA